MAILRAREAFSYTDKDGVPRIVNPGALVDSSDPGVKGREHLFETVEVAAASRANAVEQATAAPGEKRDLSSRRAGRRRTSEAKNEPSEADGDEG